jgi:NAD-dependent deacetylase
MKKQKLVVLTGSGISQESGIETFRDSNGTWEKYNVEDVATMYGWFKNPRMVNDFYNERRIELATVEPNSAHYGLKDLEEKYDVTIITQNVDDLHERAGSTKIIHLHGELTKVCNEKKKNIKDIGYTELVFGDVDESGNILRPFIVWFGEDVPMISKAQNIVQKADILVIIGTSMQVYPAAGLIESVSPLCRVFVIDPNEESIKGVSRRIEYIENVATKGVKILKNELLKNEK